MSSKRYISSLFAGAGLVVALATGATATEPIVGQPSAVTADIVQGIDEHSSDQEIERAFEFYTRTVGDNPPIFDTAAARADGASRFLIDIGRNYNELIWAQNGDRVSFPYHGRWCGPGYSGPGAPVDTLDRACMHHDKCYARRGYNSCECDDALVAEINRNYGRMNWGEKAKAQGIKLAMKVKSCN